MSLFSWLFAEKKKSHRPARPAVDSSSGMSHSDPTMPARRGGREPMQYAPGQPANRKHERMARRELLYAVVRDAMTRAGVLSSNYKFKVLSLDARGRQFLVMVDLARDHGADAARLPEVEALIAQSAKTMHDIVVSAVYWRSNDHVAVGDPRLTQTNAAPHAAAQPLAKSPAVGPASSRPMPLGSPPSFGDVSQPAALDSAPMALPAATAPLARQGGRFEPIRADEVNAFKEALAAGIKQPLPQPAVAVRKPPPAADAAAVSQGAAAVAFDGSAKHGPQSYTLLTGFEDTELPDEDMRSALSRTQYGQLN